MGEAYAAITKERRAAREDAATGRIAGTDAGGRGGSQERRRQLPVEPAADPIDRIHEGLLDLVQRVAVDYPNRYAEFRRRVIATLNDNNPSAASARAVN